MMAFFNIFSSFLIKSNVIYPLVHVKMFRFIRHRTHRPSSFTSRLFTSSTPPNVAKPSASASWNLKVPPVTSKEILKELWPLIWPKNDWKSRAKVTTAMALLLGGKVSKLSFKLKY
jgi:hypothetical protein